MLGVSDGEMLESNVFASQNINIKLFAVFGGYVMYIGVRQKIESYVLSQIRTEKLEY